MLYVFSDEFVNCTWAKLLERSQLVDFFLSQAYISIHTDTNLLKKKK